MDSVLLADFLGYYILVVSGIFLLRYEEFADYARDFADNSSLRYSIGFIELGAGLAIVLTHPVVELSYRGVITLIGGSMIIESVFHLLASDETEKRVIESLDNDFRWMAIGIISLFLGLYLVTHGFQV